MFDLLKVLNNIIDPLPENGEPVSEYHNQALRYNFDRIFAASEGAYKNAAKREATLLAELTELQKTAPDAINRKTGYTADNYEQSIKVTAVAEEIATEYQSIYLALTGNVFDHDHYQAQFKEQPKTGSSKDTKKKMNALLNAAKANA